MKNKCLTSKEWIKVLEKKLEVRERKMVVFRKRLYGAGSYTDHNAYYVQEEIKFIKEMIKQHNHER